MQGRACRACNVRLANTSFCAGEYVAIRDVAAVEDDDLMFLKGEVIHVVDTSDPSRWKVRLLPFGCRH